MGVKNQLCSIWRKVFLLASLLLVSHEQIFLFEPCHERSLCELSSPSYSGLFPICMCDDRCHIFDDCCEDAAADEKIGLEYNLEAIRRSLTCGDIQLIPDNNLIYYVQKCPDHADVVIKKRCEDDSNLIQDVLAKVPVSGVNTGLVFKNIYCAQCHRANAIERLLFWELSIDCAEKALGFSSIVEPSGTTVPPDASTTIESEKPVKVNVTDTLLSQDIANCNKRFLSPGVEPRSCQVVTDYCPPDWLNDEVAQKCYTTPSNYTHSPTESYKNYFCAVCNGEEKGSLTCQVKKQPVELDYPYSLRILLDLNHGRLTQIEKSPGSLSSKFVGENSIEKCPKEAVLDLTKSVCRPVFCESGSYLSHDGTCKPDFPLAMNPLRNVSNNGTVVSIPEAMTCPLTSLNKSEYIMYENGTLDIPAHDLTLQPEQYVVRQNSSEVAVCASYLTSSQGTIDKYFVEGYLTVIGGTLSLLGLLVVFIVYLLIPELRNLPGNCLMNLVAALFLAMLLFLLMAIPKPKSTLCLVFATGAHFFYLVAFFWMNVLGFDIWRTFQFKSLSHQSRHSRKQLIIYHLYAWLTPLLIVTIAVLVDNDVIPAKDGIKPEYGEVYCWFTTKWGMFAFFVAPAAVLLAANIIFFSLSIFSICRTSHATSAVSSDHGLSKKRHLLLNIKLSAIMGMTWTFGFLANLLPEYSVLWYLFVVTCSLQGVIICLGFVCNQKIYHALDSNLKKREALSSTKSSVASSLRKTNDK